MYLNLKLAGRPIALLFCILCSLCCSSTIFAQNVKKVRGIEGKYEISRHITLEQAEKKALEEAKIAALRKAGVSEKLWSITGMVNEQVGSEFSQAFSKMSTSQMDGVIHIIGEPEYEVRTIDGVSYAVATIDAEVKKGISIDPTFQIDMNGLAGVYAEGDLVTFTIKLYGHDAYVKIFWFDENSGALIFPNIYETKNYLLQGQEYSFPMSNLLDYKMERTDKSKEVEKVYVFAIATKEDVPFLKDEVSFESMLDWMYTIDADKRTAFGAFTLVR